MNWYFIHFVGISLRLSAVPGRNLVSQPEPLAPYAMVVGGGGGGQNQI